MSLQLNDLNDDGFRSKVNVQLAPQTPLTAQYMMELQQQFMSNPRHFYTIYEVAEASPFDLQALNRDALFSYTGSDDAELSYIALIAEIDNLFESYHEYLIQ